MSDKLVLISQIKMKTKKVGSMGRYGARYGRKMKLRVQEVENLYRTKKYECPNCKAFKVKRASTAIWQCIKCGLKFAGGAYMPFPPVKAVETAGGKIVSVEEFKKEQQVKAEAPEVIG